MRGKYCFQDLRWFAWNFRRRSCLKKMKSEEKRKEIPWLTNMNQLKVQLRKVFIIRFRKIGLLLQAKLFSIFHPSFLFYRKLLLKNVKQAADMEENCHNHQ